MMRTALGILAMTLVLWWIAQKLVKPYVNDMCAEMEEVLKPLPGELPNALGDTGTRATESDKGDEA